MNAINRTRFLLELSAISLEAGTNAQVKQNLEITDTDLTPVYLEISDLQGDVSGLQSDIIGLSGAIDNIEVDLTPIETDIENIDIAFTKLIAEEVLRADNPVVTGGDTTVAGYLEININGNTYKLALIS